MILLKIINFKFIIKYSLISLLGIISLFVLLQTIIKPNIIKSVFLSLEVVTDIFRISTYDVIMNPNLIDSYRQDFASSGNNLWRAYAWGQTFESINDAPLGWFIGLPMGSGYEFYGPSGELFENLEPHNDYISIISKIGLVGLFGYLLIIYSYLNNFLKIKESIITNKVILEEGLIQFTIVLCLLLFSFVNLEIRSYGIYFWIWIFLGFGFRFIYDRIEII